MELSLSMFSFGVVPLDLPLAFIGTPFETYHTTLPSLKHVPTVPIVGVGKKGRTLIGPWAYLSRKLPFIELP